MRQGVLDALAERLTHRPTVVRRVNTDKFVATVS